MNLAGEIAQMVQRQVTPGHAQHLAVDDERNGQGAHEYLDVRVDIGFGQKRAAGRFRASVVFAVIDPFPSPDNIDLAGLAKPIDAGPSLFVIVGLAGKMAVLAVERVGFPDRPVADRIGVAR